ncbi:Protein of unknown function [Cotesia congregata]|uniref:BEN domain-containing protein n=1 Tax=Cotesia congregata TaxID=51543 RepID=A0A8J2H2M3_COTCN|nr:Protein of unknown function [Cotesia congregata]
MISGYPNSATSTSLIPSQPPFSYNSQSSKIFMHNSLSQANTMQFTGVNPVLAGPVLASSLTSSDDNSGLRKSSSPTSQRKLLENDNTTDSDVNRHCFKSPSNKVHSMGTENKENNGSETDFSDGDDSTDHKSSSGDNSSGDDGEILSRMELGIVTSRDIFFQEQLLKAMKSKHASQIKAKNESNKTIPIEEHYYKPRNPDEKVEISENSGFYLSRVRASIIETNAVCRNDWNLMIKETLEDIYGSNLFKYCAKGKTGKHPGIDPNLFKGLFEWVNRKFDNKITDKMFTQRVARICDNKRKYKARKVHESTSNPMKHITSSLSKPCTVTSDQVKSKTKTKSVDLDGGNTSQKDDNSPVNLAKKPRSKHHGYQDTITRNYF